MEQEEFSIGKVFIDDLNKIRLVDPGMMESSSNLIKESGEFLAHYETFQERVNGIKMTIERVGLMEDGERLKLVSLQNELSQSDDVPNDETQQLQILIGEKQKELDRLKIELQSLKAVEAQQNEFLLNCQKI